MLAKVSSNGEGESLIQQDPTIFSYKTIFKLVIQTAGATTIYRILTTGNAYIGSLALAAISEDALAASGLITTLNLVIFNTATGAIKVTSIKIGNKIRKEKHGEVGLVIQQSLLYGGILTCLSCVGALVSPYCLSLFGQSDNVVAIVRSYIYPYMILTFPKIILSVFFEFYFTIYKPWPWPVIISAAFLEIPSAFIGYCWTLGKLGFSVQGPSALSYANSIFAWVGLGANIIYFIKLNRHENFIRFSLFHHYLDKKAKTFKKLFIKGSEISLSILSERFSLFFSIIMCGWLGDKQLAAQEIAAQYIFFLVVPSYGLSHGLGILVSKHKIPRDNPKKIIILGLSIGFVLSSCAVIVYNVASTQLISAFLKTSDETILGLGKSLLLITSLTAIMDVARITFIGDLRGFEDTRYTLVLSLLTMWVLGGPLSYLLGFHTPLNANGIYIGRAISIGACLFAYGGKLLLRLKNTPASTASNVPVISDTEVEHFQTSVEPAKVNKEIGEVTNFFNRGNINEDRASSPTGNNIEQQKESFWKCNIL